jgi:hypothetical protein
MPGRTVKASPPSLTGRAASDAECRTARAATTGAWSRRPRRRRGRGGRALREADAAAYNLLQAHRDQVERLVEALLQREELSRDEIDQLLKDESSNGVVTGGPVGIVAKP